jgi:hypothetical protein
MKKKIIKSQKPIEIDAHLRYVCKNPDCGYTHWLSLKETQTKDFKVVCDCGRIFKPKRVLNVKIVYRQKPKKQQDEQPQKQHFVNLSDIARQEELDIDTLNKCVKILVGYGFTKSESEQLLRNSFSSNPTNDCASLIKQTLESLGENNNDEERDSSV